MEQSTKDSLGRAARILKDAMELTNRQALAESMTYAMNEVANAAACEEIEIGFAFQAAERQPV